MSIEVSFEEQQAYEAFEKTGSKAGAANALGVPKSTIKDRIYRYIAKTKNQAVTEDHLGKYTPLGHETKNVSSLVNTATGEVKLQWIKSSKKLEDNVAALRETFNLLKEDLPKATPVEFTGQSKEELLSLYPITDYHLGQLSWKEEAGEAWNIELAEKMFTTWFATAIARAPEAKYAVLYQGGDFLHYDGLSPVTPTSKHVLDADAKYPQMVAVATRAIKSVVEMLLQKHENVHIIMAEGNHDLASSVWLRSLFTHLYENHPRVTVDNTHTSYYCVEHGLTSLFFHHGHRSRMSTVSKTFAGMFREVFGRTKYSYAHMGHLHHVDQKEDNLMIVEQHPTLAAKDSHSTQGGYNSMRGASVITYSKKYGEVDRFTIRPEMLKC